jgi:hypothetical protein
MEFNYELQFIDIKGKIQVGVQFDVDLDGQLNIVSSSNGSWRSVCQLI